MLLKYNLVLDLKLTTAIKRHCSSVFPIYTRKKEPKWHIQDRPASWWELSGVECARFHASPTDPCSSIKQYLHPLVKAKFIPAKLFLYFGLILFITAAILQSLFPQDWLRIPQLNDACQSQEIAWVSDV